ncbi:PRD domain-containing protein [Vagococcus vulneris]|uniref:PRD domain-containing protein n=1 Tax=Vagococcus vulneris TaxID=1977869 RepID=A0A430A0I4_9ENTE|nr:PRD domain-containing protein [Vagococcus vulneris]RST99839.1 hypothetical protein CBF37_03705 [Vagococcus vulneris]
MIYSTVKSLNNNLVLATDPQGEEFVLFGNGIGFSKKRGDVIENHLVQKIFYAKNDNQDLVQMFSEISPDILAVTERIIEMSEQSLGKDLNNSLMIALSDHIQSAYQRVKNNETELENALQWEIPFLYVREAELGKRAVELINQELSTSFPKVEESFIALHLVSAQDGLTSMRETMLVTEITKEMVKLIQSLFGVSLDKESMTYSRFVTHIRYFINRQFHQEEKNNESNNQKLYEIIQEQYQKSYACALVIREMLLKKYDLVISDDEIVYLVIHIDRVVSESKK